ncbi:hypothetical protein ACWD25_43645 [Streptomyces sp. NPDC002920]
MTALRIAAGKLRAEENLKAARSRLARLRREGCEVHWPRDLVSVQFGELSPFPLVDGAEIRFQRRRVGLVTAVWQEREQVLWRGLLDEREWPDNTADAPLRVPFVEPDVRTLVEARRLIGMPAVVQTRTETRNGCMLVTDWTSRRDGVDDQGGRTVARHGTPDVAS